MLVYLEDVASYVSYIKTISIEFLVELFRVYRKMDLSIQMRIFNDLKYYHAIFLKSQERSFTSLTMLALETKALFSNQRKSYFELKFSAVVSLS